MWIVSEAELNRPRWKRIVCRILSYWKWAAVVVVALFGIILLGVWLDAMGRDGGIQRIKFEGHTYITKYNRGITHDPDCRCLERRDDG